MMTAGRAPRLEAGIPLHQPVTLEEPAGAYRWERFPVSASLVRKLGSEGPPPASKVIQTGRCLLPRLPTVSEKEAELRVSVVMRVQNQAGGGYGGASSTSGVSGG
jgi:hypothetical protein